MGEAKGVSELMNDSFQMGVMCGVTDAGHQLEARTNAEIMLLRIAPKLDAVHIFHCKVGEAAFVSIDLTGFENLCDTGMLGCHTS